MSKLIKFISVILALLMSYFVAGDPEGFEATVVNPVTTQTMQFEVHMVNKTGKKVHDPRITALEVCIDGEWTEIGRTKEYNDIAETWKPLTELTDTFHLNSMNIYEPLEKGEYRVVIDFAMDTKDGKLPCESYAYFTVA